MTNAKSAGHRSFLFSSFANRRNLLGMSYLAAIFIGFALGGCDTGKVDAAAEINTKGQNHMESIQTTTTIQNKIPPIDAAISTGTETATFAMG